jgi:hypothetical protein
MTPERLAELRRLDERDGPGILVAALHEALEALEGVEGAAGQREREEVDARILSVMRPGVTLSREQIAAEALLTPRQMEGALERLCVTRQLEAREFRFGVRYVRIMPGET